MSGGERWVDKTEIAFLMGVEPRTITNYIKKHRDFPSRMKRGGREREFPVRRCLQWQTDRVVSDVIASTEPKAPTDLEEAQARKMTAEAELAEIKVARARGQVLDTTVIGREVRDAYGRLRSSLIAKPGEYGPRMLHLTSVGEAVRLLRNMINDCLADLQMVGGTTHTDHDDADGADEPKEPDDDDDETSPGEGA